MGIDHLHDKAYTDISGGERQLVMLARALAQNRISLFLTNLLQFGLWQYDSCDEQNPSFKGQGYWGHNDHPLRIIPSCANRQSLCFKRMNPYYSVLVDVITEKNLKDAYGISVKLVEFFDHKGRLMRMCSPIID